MINKRSLLSLSLIPLLAACGASSGNPNVYALYGDSTAFGWLPDGQRISPTPAEHLSSLLDAPVLDYSYPGASVVQAKISKDSSNVVIFRFGVADAAMGIPYIVFCQHYLRLADEARAAGKQVFVVQPTVSLVEYYPPPFDNVIDIKNVTPHLVDNLHPSKEYSQHVDEVIAKELLK